MPHSAAPQRSEPRKLGLLGLGAFGRLAALHLAPHFQIVGYDPDPKSRKLAARLNVHLGSLEEAAACPYVVIAAPVRRIAELARAIAPHLTAGATVFDVGSVKVLPAQQLTEILPAHVDIICTHPLFGPQSARRGLQGLEIVVCPVRTQRSARALRFFDKALDLKVSVATPEAHDKALAAVQGLTHLIAKVMSGLEPLPTQHTTRSYDLMMQGIGLVQGDSDELFLAIERDNPFAAEVRKRFFAEIDALRQRLEDQHDGG